MRRNIVHIGASELSYEIRQITDLADQVQALSGRPVYWENIGDPVQKGEKLPVWIKEIVSEAVWQDKSYAYCPTQGLLATRDFLAEQLNQQGGIQISSDDIIFFNGLGDAINKVFSLLSRQARVIGPNPSYPAHSSAEAAHAGAHPITYKLDPHNNWLPDLDDLEYQIETNRTIAGILLINPNNPTGSVLPGAVLESVVAMARKYDLFLLVDEIYSGMVFADVNFVPLSAVAGDVPAIVLKGISKELPWPGGRCGWIEVYNREADRMFGEYVDSILNAKQLEVCSTTLPQMVLPQILKHPNYAEYRRQRNDFFQQRSRRATELLADCPVTVHAPGGAFYLCTVFTEEITADMHLTINEANIQTLLAKQPCTQPDQRFVYNLLAARNICVVPLTGFASSLFGFRATLLEQDDETFEYIYTNIAEAIQEFFASGKKTRTDLRVAQAGGVL